MSEEATSLLDQFAGHMDDPNVRQAITTFVMKHLYWEIQEILRIVNETLFSETPIPDPPSVKLYEKFFGGEDD